MFEGTGSPGRVLQGLCSGAFHWHLVLKLLLDISTTKLVDLYCTSVLPVIGFCGRFEYVVLLGGTAGCCTALQLRC